MHKTILLLSIALITCSCEQKADEQTELAKDSLQVQTDSVTASTQTMDVVAEDKGTDPENNSDANELNYVVVVAEGYHYDSLRNIAIQSSQHLNFKFDTLDRYYNTTQKKIVLPINDEDDIWAGEYYFRRYGEDFVSIEMMSAYIDTLTAQNKIWSEEFYKDRTKMFVFAAMYSEKEQADSLAKVLRPKFPFTRIIPSNIYMGCMH